MAKPLQVWFYILLLVVLVALLDQFQQGCVPLVSRATELDTALQIRCCYSRGAGSCLSPTDHTAFDTAQAAIGLVHIHLFTHQHPRVLFYKATLSLIILQPGLISRIALRLHIVSLNLMKLSSAQLSCLSWSLWMVPNLQSSQLHHSAAYQLQTSVWSLLVISMHRADNTRQRQM